MENDSGIADPSRQKQTEGLPTISRGVFSQTQPRSPLTGKPFADALLNRPSPPPVKDGNVPLSGRAQELLDSFLRVQLEQGCDISRSMPVHATTDRKSKQPMRPRMACHPYAEVNPSTGLTPKEETAFIRRGIPPLLLHASLSTDLDSDEAFVTPRSRPVHNARRARRCGIYEDEIDPNQLAVFDTLAEWGRWHITTQEARRRKSLPRQKHSCPEPSSPLSVAEEDIPSPFPEDAGADKPDACVDFADKAQREFFACITDHKFAEEAARLWNPGPMNEDLEPTRLMADAVAALVEARVGRAPCAPTPPTTQESASVYFEDEAFISPWQYILTVIRSVQRPLCAFLQTGTNDVMRIMTQAENSELHVGLQCHNNEWWLALGDNKAKDRLDNFVAKALISDVGLHGATVQNLRKVKWGAGPLEIEAEVEKAAEEYKSGTRPSWPMQFVTGVAGGLLVWVDMSLS